MKRFDLEERMIDYASNILELVEQLPQGFAPNHLGKQLIRSATSTALNYGEGQAAESRADFIHKLKVSLKELKESQICLKILNKRKYLPNQMMDTLIKETDELISILVASVKTAKRNQQKEKGK